MKWAAIGFLLALVGPVVAGDIDSLVVTCDGCHGKDGVSQHSIMPTIAGISEFVHADALFAYQDSARPCQMNQPLNMCAAVADLTETQIESLASYYAAKPFVAAAQEFDPAVAARGAKIHEQACQRCHSDNGSNPEDDASILKGQWMGYMRQTFADYGSGTREQPDKMKLKMDALSEDDTEALIHFYASPD